MNVIGSVGNPESTLQIPGLVPVDYESGLLSIYIPYSHSQENSNSPTISVHNFILFHHNEIIFTPS